MQYVINIPKPPLSEFVERFWYSRGATLNQSVRIMPTGTMELVFNLEEDELGFYDAKQPGSYKTFSGAIFSGAHARPLLADTREHMMGVHFKPGGAFRFLGVPASEVADTHVDVEDLWGRVTQDLREQLCAAVNPGASFGVLEKALFVRLVKSPEEHRAVRAAVDILGRDAGETRIRDLAAQLGLSQRHLASVFSKQVGVTPKQFARVQRFLHATQLTRSNSAPDWAEVALACGYFDQSHLIHEFQILSGLSPTEFHRQRRDHVLTSDLPLVA